MSEKETSEHKHLTPEEIKALIAESGTELSDEDLEQISGGWGDNKPQCPEGQHDYQYKGLQVSPGGSGTFRLYVCSKCGDGILE